MSIAQGNLANRPYGRMVFSLSQQQFCGQLTLELKGKTFSIRFNRGLIVDADSPDANDSLAKIASKTGLANKTQLAAFLAAKRKQPDANVAELLTTAARLSPEQVAQLQRHRVAQAAARTFGLPGADFECTAEEANDSRGVITVEWVVFHGLRHHYDSQRLRTELGSIGARRFRLHTKTFETRRGSFSFDSACAPVLMALGSGYQSAKDIVQRLDNVPLDLQLMVIYSVWACDCLEFEGEEPVTERPTQPPVATAEASAEPSAPAEPPATELEITLAEPATAPQPATASPATAAPQPATAPATAAPQPAPASASPATAAPQPAPASASPATAPAPAKPRRARKAKSPKMPLAELQAMVDDHIAAFAADADHFALLGVDRGCSAKELQTAYFKIAKDLHPDRLHARGVAVDPDISQRLLAAINQAFTVLSDAEKRSHYLEVLAAGGELAYRKKQEEAETQARNIFAAEENFLAGEMALRRNAFGQALEFFEKSLALNAEEGEHHAYVGWALWMSESDKDRVRGRVETLLAKGRELSPKSPRVRFFEAQFSNSLGDHKKAAQLYQETLKLEPGNSEAQLQLRLLTSRGLA